jgi:hypothetical protein
VSYWTGTSSQSGEPAFYWDSSNDELRLDGEMAIFYGQTPRYGDYANYCLETSCTGANSTIIENREIEGAGFGANHNSAMIWSPADGNLLLGFVDEDNQTIVAGIDGAGVSFDSSDGRAKRNIQPMDGVTALSQVQDLQGVTYQYNRTEEEYEKGGDWLDQRYMGFIAQEVQDVAPELVLEGNDRLYLYSNKFAPLLVEAIKELSLRVELLEDQLDACQP